MTLVKDLPLDERARYCLKGRRGFTYPVEGHLFGYKSCSTHDVEMLTYELRRWDIPFTKTRNTRLIIG